MVLESWVIIIILSIAAYMFIRSKRAVWAPCVLPLMLVPFINILYHPVGRQLARTDASAANAWKLIVNIAAFAAASLWVLHLARKLPRGKSQYAYVISSIVFIALLVVLYALKVAF